MALIRNPEVRGLLIILLVILLIGGTLAVATGKLETWFGITLGGGTILDRVVYVSDNSGSRNLCSIKPNGSSQEQFTTGVSVLSKPFVSVGGKRVVFVGSSPKGSQVFTVSGRGGTPSRLTSATNPKQQPEYSPSGMTLSFIAGGKVYTSDLGGNDLRQVFPTDEETHIAISQRTDMPAYHQYVWTPDGQGMVGITRDANDSDILVLLPTFKDEAKRLPISQNQRARINGLAWAPDGSTLYIAATVGDRGVVLAFNPSDGSGKVLAAVPKQEFASPTASPDGQSVIWCASSDAKGGINGIVHFDMQNGQPQLLAKGHFEDSQYSPDGESLLATRIDDSKHDVIVLGLGDGKITELTTDGHSFDPVWTPQSKK